jgi:hypothetical protein
MSTGRRKCKLSWTRRFLVDTLTRNTTRSISFPHGSTIEDSAGGTRKNESPYILYIFQRETAADIKQSRKQGTEYYFLE